MLAFRVKWQTESGSYSEADVAFLNSAARTVTRVSYFLANSDDYPDIGVPDSIARLIADRVMPATAAAPQSAGSFGSLLRSLIELIK